MTKAKSIALFGCFCGKYGVRIDGELQPGPCLNLEEADKEIERLRSEETPNVTNPKNEEK